jgi:aminopeptidase YwaD
MDRLDVENMIRSRFNGDYAKKHVEVITEFYRTAGSSGYHHALDYARNQLEGYGIHTKVETYPLDGKTELLGHKMAIAWEPIDARLEIVSPIRELLTTYSETPTCMMWWSASTPSEGVEAEIVNVGQGVDESDYDKLDVSRKIVLAAGDGEQHSASRIYALAVERFGAIGILTDCLLYQHPRFRTRVSQPDLVQLFRLAPKRNDFWGIALSHKQAEKLRGLCQEGRVIVRVRIETRMFEGIGENLVWSLGDISAKQQVLLISHISATKPGANCASGPAAMIEITRTLLELERENKLRKLSRNIKFLVGAEGYGVSAYFAAHSEQISNTVAAICLDSVGHDQSKCNSSIVLYRTPDSTSSFVNDLAAQVFTDLQSEGEPPYKSTKDIPLSRFVELPYTPWSDNSALTALGVPCPLIMSWPDTYFHTQALDTEKTDPRTFNFSGSAIASIAALLARETDQTPEDIIRIIASRAKLRISEVMLQSRDWQRAAEEIDYLIERDLTAIKSVLRLSTRNARRLKKTIDNTRRLLLKDGDLAKGTLPKSKSPQKRLRRNVSLQIVPRRVKVSVFPRFAGLTYEELKSLYAEVIQVDPSLKFYALVPISSEISNLVDGHRSVSYITKAVSFQYQVSLRERHVLRFLNSLERLGYISMKTRE